MASCDECGKRPSTKTTNADTVIDLCPFNKMADGRAFTDYRSRCQKVTSMSSYDERMFIMNNAESLIASTNNKFVCSSCALKSPGAKSTMLPEKFKQVCNKNTCTFQMNDENGLGLGR